MRCFPIPNVGQLDKNKKRSFTPIDGWIECNGIVKGSEVFLQIRDENASEEEEAKELRLVSNLSVAEVDVVKPRGNVDFDGWIEYSLSNITC